MPFFVLEYRLYLWVTPIGEMSERFKEPVLKTGDSQKEPWVRIPLSPPFLSRKIEYTLTDTSAGEVLKWPKRRPC